MRHIQIGTIQTSEMDIPFLASLQVVWNGELLLGDQAGSEERRRKHTMTTPTRRRAIIMYDVDIQRRYDRMM